MLWGLSTELTFYCEKPKLDELMENKTSPANSFTSSCMNSCNCNYRTAVIIFTAEPTITIWWGTVRTVVLIRATVMCPMGLQATLSRETKNLHSKLKNNTE